MAEPNRNLTPEELCNILVASKERGDEYFSEQHKLKVQISGAEGLLLKITLGNQTNFGIELQKLHQKGNSIPEGIVQLRSLLFQYYRKSHDTIIIYCNRPDKVLEDIIEHLKTEFGMQLEELKIGPGHFDFLSVQSISHWLRAKQYPLKCLYVLDGGVPMDQDQFKFILDNIKPTDTVYTYVKLPPGFSYNFDNTCQTIYIGGCGEWLTLANLLNTRSHDIFVFGSSFTNRDIVEYLNQWAPHPTEVGNEAMVIQLQELVEIATIVSQTPGSQEIARYHHHSIEERRIKFQDGRMVHFEVTSTRPRELMMYLYPARPEDQ